MNNPSFSADLEVIRRALRIAQAAVAADIQSSCHRVRAADAIWYDTQPALDPREHSPEVLDMTAEALRFGFDTGLLVRHPHQPHWVRIVERTA